jgi:hypothetical protein
MILFSKQKYIECHYTGDKIEHILKHKHSGSLNIKTKLNKNYSIPRTVLIKPLQWW